MKKRVVFEFSVSNVIDLITNSSSELFVLNGMTREIVTEMVKSVYEDYLTEYEEIKSFDDLDEWELSTYLDSHYPKGIPGFTPFEVFEDYDPVSRYGRNYYNTDFLKNNRDKIKEFLIGVETKWFLFSLSDNPNWDKQEELMNIGQRIHLG